MTDYQFVVQALVLVCAILGGAAGYYLSLFITPRRASDNLAALIVAVCVLSGLLASETALICFLASIT